MNLGQALDPEWVQAGAKRRPFERTAPVAALEAAAQAEASRLAVARREDFDLEQAAARRALREAQERAERARDREAAERERGRHEAQAAARRAADERRAELERKAARKRTRRDGSKTLEILRALDLLEQPEPIGVLAERLPEMAAQNIAAFLVQFVARGLARRFGALRRYRYCISAAGRDYLKKAGAAP